MQNKRVFQWILACSLITASADVEIGINLQVFPELVAVPNYPVYYVPGMNSNYFYFDGRYWVLAGDNWYSSAWYNGPWKSIDPAYVPDYVLRIPVTYYGQPPAYFGGWQANAAPHWGEHWGGGWSQRRSGWDRWDHNAMPARTPLPEYQRQYSGNRYPAPAQQHALQAQHPQNQPHNPITPQHAAAKPQETTKAVARPAPQVAQANDHVNRPMQHTETAPAPQQHTPRPPREEPPSAEHVQPKEQAPHAQIMPPPHPQQVPPPQERPHEQQNRPAQQPAKPEEKAAKPNEHPKEEEHKE